MIVEKKETTNNTKQSVKPEHFCLVKDPKELLEEIPGDQSGTYTECVQLIGDLKNIQNLTDLVTKETGVKVSKIIQHGNPYSCMVKFDYKDPKFKSNIIPSKWEMVTFGRYPMIKGPVYVTNSFCVSGVTEAITIETLKTFLETDKARGGRNKKVKYLEHIGEGQELIVYYEDTVEKNKYLELFDEQFEKINGVKIYVSYYFPCLSRAYIYSKETSKSSEMGVFVMKVFPHQKNISLAEPHFSLLLRSHYFDQIRNNTKNIFFSFDFKNFRVILKGNDETEIRDVEKDILEKCRKDITCLNLFHLKSFEKTDMHKKLDFIFKKNYILSNGNDSKIYYLKSKIGNMHLNSFYFSSKKQAFMSKYLMQEFDMFKSCLKSDTKIHFIPENCLIIDTERQVEQCEKFLKHIIVEKLKLKDKIDVIDVNLKFFGIQETLKLKEIIKFIESLEDKFRCIIVPELNEDSSRISEEVDIKIYSDIKENRTLAANTLKEDVKSAYTRIEINAEDKWHQLNASEIQSISDQGLQYVVKVSFNKDQKIIKLEGFSLKDFIQQLSPEWQKIFSEKEKDWHSSRSVISLPTNWDSMSETENLKIVEIKKKSPEYSEIEKHFQSTSSHYTIKKIERIQNICLYQQYSVKKKELDLHNPPGHQNEKKLFHGTDAQSIKPINENGFNRSYCGVNGTVYGMGVYFATTSEYSSIYAKQDNQGHGHMYRARVLTGEFIETNKNTKYLPNKPGTHRPYDSGGNLNKGIYVIFHDSQVYPEYLITF